MKKITNLILFLGVVLLAYHCEEPYEETPLGSISGLVIDYETNNTIAKVLVSTTPPTHSIMTSEDGSFLIKDVDPGSYTINCQKYSYKNSFTSASIKEGKQTDVIIQLEKDDDNNALVILDNPIPAKQAQNMEPSLTLHWELYEKNLATELSYQVTIYGNNSSTPKLKSGSINDTFYVINNLKYEENYLWQVTAYKEETQVGQSALWEFSTTTEPHMTFLFVNTNDQQIYTTNSKDAPQIQLSNETFSNAYPISNPITGELLFSAITNSQTHLFKTNSSGDHPIKITELPLAGYHNSGEGFCWSPDGNHLLYCHYDKLYKLNKDGSELKTLCTAPNNRNFVYVDYSGATKKIIVQTRGINIYDNEFYTMNEDGSNLTMVIENKAGISQSPTFSIDGNSILYTHDISGLNSPSGRQLDANIFKYNLSDNTTINLSEKNKTKGTNDLQPRFSLDGSKIIFVNTSNIEGSKKNIYIMDSDGNNRELYFENGEMPVWR